MAEAKKIEHIILHNLIKYENYARKVSPFLKKEYFQNTSERKLLEIIQ